MQKKSIESNKDKLMSKKKLKAEIREKGITLVALVITIIVLLILAGITINSVIGSKGILNNAKKATNAYNKSATEENEVLDYYANEMEKASIGKGSSESNPITYTDTNGKTQTLAKGTAAGTKVGTTVVDGQTLDWYLFDVSDDGKTAYLVSTPTYWVPDVTKVVSGAYTPKLVSSYDSNTYAMRQAIQKLANGTNSYNQSSVTYKPSDDTWKYFKRVNSQWSSQRGSIAFASLNENEQAACYLADADIFAGIKDQVNNANGNLKGKIKTLVGGASAEQWCNAYNKQSAASSSKITCEYRATSVPGYIYKVNGNTSTVSNSEYWTGTNTIYGDDIYGAANKNGHTSSDNKFYNNSWWWLASPSSYGSYDVCYVSGITSSLNFYNSYSSSGRLSLFASVAL